MNRQFWKVAHHELKNRLNHHDEFCDPDCQVCSALTIIMENEFLKKEEKRYLVSPNWRVMLLKILDEMFGEETTKENVLETMYYLSELEASVNDWNIINLYYGGNDGFSYSVKDIAYVYRAEVSDVWRYLCGISTRMRASLNTH
jgi:hypothetical protein